MASAQSLANKTYWEAAAEQGPLTPEAMIERVDIRWTPLSAEPGGVDYLEVDAGGIRAMWVRPKGAADDHLVLRRDDGTFLHLFRQENGAPALSESEAFRTFQKNISERCRDRPVAAEVAVVGSYGDVSAVD